MEPDWSAFGRRPGGLPAALLVLAPGGAAALQRRLDRTRMDADAETVPDRDGQIRRPQAGIGLQQVLQQVHDLAGPAWLPATGTGCSPCAFGERGRNQGLSPLPGGPTPLLGAGGAVRLVLRAQGDPAEGDSVGGCGSWAGLWTAPSAMRSCVIGSLIGRDGRDEPPKDGSPRRGS